MPWTLAHQALLSMGFSRLGYWSELPFPTPVDFPNKGTEPKFLASPALAGRFFTTYATWETPYTYEVWYNSHDPQLSLSRWISDSLLRKMYNLFPLILKERKCKWNLFKGFLLEIWAKKVISGWICDILFPMTTLAICTFPYLKYTSAKAHTHTNTCECIILLYYTIEAYFWNTLDIV